MPPPKNIAPGLRLWLHLPVAQTPVIAGRSRVRILYSGHVQGVGFRYTAKTVAAGFEITGVVRNLPDGRVELVAEGDRGGTGSVSRGGPRCRSCWPYSR